MLIFPWRNSFSPFTPTNLFWRIFRISSKTSCNPSPLILIDWRKLIGSIIIGKCIIWGFKAFSSSRSDIFEPIGEFRGINLLVFAFSKFSSKNSFQSRFFTKFRLRRDFYLGLTFDYLRKTIIWAVSFFF